MHAPDCAPEDSDAGSSAAAHSVGCSHMCGARSIRPGLPCSACPSCPALLCLPRPRAAGLQHLWPLPAPRWPQWPVCSPELWQRWEVQWDRVPYARCCLASEAFCCSANHGSARIWTHIFLMHTLRFLSLWAWSIGNIFSAESIFYPLSRIYD